MPDLLELSPIARVKSETDPEGRVTLLRPKFTWGPLARFLQPRLRRPYFRVHLDELGSAAWQAMDGHRTVAQIAAAMRERFGEKVEPIERRLALFLRELERGRMIRFGP